MVRALTSSNQFHTTVHFRSDRWELTPGTWTARTRLFVLLVAMIHVAVVWSLRTPIVTTGQDDAEYILLSREIAQGNYRDSHDVNAPMHARYPPGYPAFLAGVRALAGDREPAYLLVNALLSGGALLLFLVWGCRNLSSPTWFAIAALVTLNPELIFLSGKILSEPLFFFFVYLTLWAESQSATTERATWATVAASVTTLVRSAGLAIPVGLIGARLFQRRWIAAAALTILTALSGGLWAWNSARAPQAAERLLYVADLQKVAALEEHSAIGALVQRVRYKAEELTLDELPTALSVPAIPGTWIDNAMGALVIVVLLPLGILCLWKRSKTAAAMLLAYGALYVVWPYGQVRLIVPVVPLILVAMFLAAEFIGARIRRSWAVPVAIGSLTLYLAIGVILRLGRDRDYLSGCDRGHAPYSQPACYPMEGDWTFLQATKYVKENLPADAVVFTVKEPTFYYHSGRKTVNLLVLLKEDSTTLAKTLRQRGVGWVVTSYSGPSRTQMGKLVASACRDFDLVKQIDARTMVLRVRPAGQTDGETACGALTTWRQDPGRPEAAN